MNRPATCYLSFAIDLDEDPLRTSRQMEVIEKRLHHLAILTFNPKNAYQSWKFDDPQHQEYVRQVNQAALRSADFVLMIWGHKTPSWGMPIELQDAWFCRKPVIFITDAPPDFKIPMYLGHKLLPLEQSGTKLYEIGSSILRLLNEASLTARWRVLNEIKEKSRAIKVRKAKS